MNVKVAIVGAGIGGLAAAAFLHQRGIRSTVYEQASELTEVGAGLVTPPNAARLVRRLGGATFLDERACCSWKITWSLCNRRFHRGGMRDRRARGRC